MKKSMIFLTAITLVFGQPFFSSVESLNTQTNFVRYANNPIIPLGAPGEWDDVSATFAYVLYNKPLYQMWYSASGDPTREVLRIGYASPEDGLHWQKHENNPVLRPGAPGERDDEIVGWPCVQFNGQSYEMWYNNFSSDFSFQIGYATSPDGVNWTKYENNPVFEGGSPGEWDDFRVTLPYVLRTDTLYHMWYGGSRETGPAQTGYATSSDGINWTRHPDNPILQTGEQGEWDYGKVTGRSFFYEDGCTTCTTTQTIFGVLIFMA